MKREEWLTTVPWWEARSTYYIRCSWCGDEVYGGSEKEAADRANRWGWKYGPDGVLCNECVNEYLESEGGPDVDF